MGLIYLAKYFIQLYVFIWLIGLFVLEGLFVEL